MSHCHITRITQIPNLEIGCKTLYRVQNRRYCGRYIGSMSIYWRFWMKNAISVWMCQIIAVRCRKRNISAISGLYRGYLEHWTRLTMNPCIERFWAFDLLQCKAFPVPSIADGYMHRATRVGRIVIDPCLQIKGKHLIRKVDKLGGNNSIYRSYATVMMHKDRLSGLRRQLA